MNLLDLDFIEKAKASLPDAFKGKKVLEIGALDVNGNVRGPFEDCEFTGVDWVAGKNVDVVMKGADADLGMEKYDVLLSANHLEHDPEWEKTMHVAITALKEDGILLLRWATRRSSPHGPEFDPHGKNGYYPKDLEEVVECLKNNYCLVLDKYCDQNPSIGVMANIVARKLGPPHA